MFEMSDKLRQSDTLVITRYLNRPVARIYDAFTNPVLLEKWFAPNIRWNRVDAEADVTVGGTYKISMHHIDGDCYTVVGRYLDVAPRRRLQFTFKWLPGIGNSEPSTVTIDFAGIGNETELRIMHVNIAEQEHIETRRGWEGCLDVLETLVEEGMTHLGEAEL